MKKILLVDDEPDILTLGETLLRSAGYDVVSARNGEECLTKLKNEKFDMVLLDVMMPGSDDGWEVCRKIKAGENTNSVPVILFTVCSESWEVSKGKEVGASAQINKPFEVEEFIGTVKKVLKENKA